MENKNIEPKVMLSDKVAIKIKDSLSADKKEGYVALPDRVPISLFIGWVIQFVVLAVGGTSMYHNIKSNQEQLAKQVQQLEERMSKEVYTRHEAIASKEIQKVELEKLRLEILKHASDSK